MADANKDRFLERLGSIEKKSQPGKRLEKRVTEDGLVVHVAKTKSSSLIPYRGILTGMVLFVLLKGFVLAELGEPIYQERIENLRSGSAIEVLMAFGLDVDPASKMVADLVGSFRS